MRSTALRSACCHCSCAGMASFPGTTRVPAGSRGCIGRPGCATKPCGPPCVLRSKRSIAPDPAPAGGGGGPGWPYGRRRVQAHSDLTMAIEPRRQAEAGASPDPLGWRPRLVGVRRWLRWRLLRSGTTGASPDRRRSAAKPLRLCLGAPWAVADSMAWQGAQPLGGRGHGQAAAAPWRSAAAADPWKRTALPALAPPVDCRRYAAAAHGDTEPLAARSSQVSPQKTPAGFPHGRLIGSGELVDDPAPAALLAQLER